MSRTISRIRVHFEESRESAQGLSFTKPGGKHHVGAGAFFRVGHLLRENAREFLRRHAFTLQGPLALQETRRGHHHYGVALFFAAAMFPADAVTIEGETADYEGRHFCPHCGSSVFARSGDEIEVHLGTLDEPNRLMPTYETWTLRRENWLPPFPLSRHYEKDRENDGRHEG